jgi:hypothetical protein
LENNALWIVIARPHVHYSAFLATTDEPLASFRLRNCDPFLRRHFLSRALGHDLHQRKKSVGGRNNTFWTGRVSTNRDRAAAWASLAVYCYH